MAGLSCVFGKQMWSSWYRYMAATRPAITSHKRLRFSTKKMEPLISSIYTTYCRRNGACQTPATANENTQRHDSSGFPPGGGGGLIGRQAIAVCGQFRTGGFVAMHLACMDWGFGPARASGDGRNMGVGKAMPWARAGGLEDEDEDLSRRAEPSVLSEAIAPSSLILSSLPQLHLHIALFYLPFLPLSFLQRSSPVSASVPSSRPTRLTLFCCSLSFVSPPGTLFTGSLLC